MAVEGVAVASTRTAVVSDRPSDCCSTPPRLGPLQDALLKARLKLYSAKAHKRVKDTTEEDREATVCQRENPFYVNTVKLFRDR